MYMCKQRFNVIKHIDSKVKVQKSLILLLIFMCNLLLLSCDFKSNSSEGVESDEVDADTIEIVEEKSALLMPSASINKVWTTQFYNTITIHADFDVDNMINKTGTFVVYVTKQFTHDKPVEVYWYDTFTPPYENCNYSDFKYTIKKEQLTKDYNFKGETHFKAYIKIYDDRERLLATSEYASFTIKQYEPLFQ